MTPDAFLRWAQIFPEALLLVAGSGTILAANAAAGRLIGRPSPALQGTPLQALVATPAAQVSAYLQACARTRAMVLGALAFCRAVGPPTVCRAEGAVLTPHQTDAPAVLLLRCTPRAVAAQPFGALNEKIQELTRANAQLRRAHEHLRHERARFEVTLTSLGEAVIATDAHGRVTLMNPAAEALTGWSQAHALGQPLAAVVPLVHEKTRQAVEDPVAAVVRAGTAVDLAPPTLLLARDGAGHAIEGRGAPMGDAHRHPLGVVFVLREITERRRMEAALTRAAALLELTYESILVLDLDDTITFWNRGATLMYGWTAEEAVGQVAYRLLQTQFPKPFEAIKADFLRTGRWEGDLVHTTRDGASLVVASRWALQRDAEGQPLAFLELNSDITARKHAEDALQQLNATLEARVQARTQELAETNAALEAFAASVAHDLRAPLRSIHGFAQALVDDYGAQLEATGQDFLRRIIRASTRMDTLIQDLLTYSRLSREALPLEPVPLQTALRAAQAQLHGDLQARDAVLQLEAPLPAVIAHYPVLVQALVNLLANAIKFTDPGVRPVVTVRADRTEDEVRLWIEDNGIGIPAEYQERIFQVFERLHAPDVYAGTGIGLAIVRLGVERMGGHVGVVSAPGQGSRFWLTLRPAHKGA